MAATMKHRRSASKKKSTRGSDRYDKVLTRFKKMKKNGGTPITRLAGGKKVSVSHRVSKDNPVYKGVKVIRTKEK